MRKAVLLPLALTGLALASCGPSQDSTPAQPEAPADAPAATPAADFAKPLNALGNEPFWALKIRPEGLTFSAAGEADVTAPNPGAKVGPAQAVWTAAAADGRPLVATLTVMVCEDSGSGVNYPFTAEVRLGDRTLKGCATYADQAPGA